MATAPSPTQRVPLTERLGFLLTGKLPASMRDPRDGFTDAGTPLQPTEPEGQPRLYEQRTGVNLTIQPRAGQLQPLTPFAQLRALSDFDLVRIVINDVKGQVRGMSWDVRVRKEFKDEEEELQAKVDSVRAWLEHPDPLEGLDFDDWIGGVLEEVLVTDALAVYPQRTLKGEPIGLVQIDGTTIKPLVDDRGRRPLPPNAAYQQIIRGIPEREYEAGDLWYLPRNRRANSPYGRSPVEDVIVTVNLAIRQSLHELAWFTNGSIPDSLYQMPGTMSTKQVTEFQQMWDDLLSGQSNRRAGGLRFLPGGDGGQYIATKDRQLLYEEREWLARVIAWAFNVSPMPIAKIVNRATAETMEVSSTESGVRPYAGFVARPINRYIATELQAPEIEFAWGEDEVEDPAVVYQRNVAYMNAGARTLNEVRADNGEDPYPPEIGDRAFVMTPTGPLFLDTIEEERKRKEEAAAAFRERLTGAKQAPPAEGEGAEPPSPEPPEPPQDGDAEKRADLSRWRRVALRLAKAGKRQRGFNSTAIPVIAHRRITLMLAKARTQDDVWDIFAKADPSPVGQADAQAGLLGLLRAWLDEKMPGILSWAGDMLTGKIGKALAKQEPLPGLDDLDLDLTSIFDELTQWIDLSAKAGSQDIIASMGIDLVSPDAETLEFAASRAAELVGKSWVDGALVDNPNPVWAISEQMRSDINDKVTKAITEGWSPQKLASELNDQLGDWRAKTIARTETAFAYGHGAQEAFAAAGQEHVEILDGPGCLPAGHRDGAPAPSKAVGIVEEDAQANGQIWTLEQYRANTIGHPNCVRAAVAYFPEGGGDVGA